MSTARLADYTGRVAGDLEANGSIVRRDQRFAVNLAARSDSLRYGEVGLTGFSADISTSDGETHTMSVRSARIEAADRGVDRVELDVLLAPDRQRLDLGLESLGYAIGLELDGAFDDWDRPLESTWRGSLESFDLATPSDRIGELQAPAGLVASAASVALDDFCVGGTDEASLCAGLDWAKDGELEFRGDATRLPLDIVNAFVQTGFDFSQALTGSVRWLVKDSGPTGRVDLRLTAGQVTSDVFPDLDLATDVGVIAFEVEDGQLLEGQLELPLPGTGFVNGQFVLDDIKLGTSSPIEGSLNAQIDDIEVIAVFLPDIEKAAGEISADVEVGGTLGAPLFSGRAALERGALVYFPLGLALDSIELIGRMNNQRGMDLEGSLRAGDGVATIRTSRDSAEDEQPGLHFEISGRNLSVVNLPDMTALANADLELDLKGRRLDINGNIDIPFARIRPRNLAVTRIDESEDVVIVAGELPDAALAEEESPDLEVFGRLGVGLGPDVQVNLDLASASLTGAVDYEWNGDLMPIGQGRYDVVGTVQAFGQVLNITEGSVRFPNVPVDNPNIRVRATREIFGNSQIKRAGILVSGSARRPTIEAYTDPRTTEERALTLLITGNDFDFEKGVGAVDFGTYVAPRLFLSYGVAVFTRDNIVSARYDLTTGWGVRVSSGAKDSGVDMTYRIER